MKLNPITDKDTIENLTKLNNTVNTNKNAYENSQQNIAIATEVQRTVGARNVMPTKND